MRIALALVLFAGCDVVYGLTGRDSGTTADDVLAIDADPCANDRDCDLVLDPIDNCIDVPNPDQDDFDDDDIGDRCDPCSTSLSTVNDDDSDSFVDKVDKCPAVVDTQQLDADGDTVGDVCDPRSSASDTLACFFSFADVDETIDMWSLGGSWSVAGSRVVHGAAATAPFVVALMPNGMLTAGERFEVQTATAVSAGFAAPFEVGIGIGGPALTDPGVRCVMDGAFQSAQTATLYAANGSMLAQMTHAPLGSDQRIALRFERLGGQTMLTCTLVDGVGTTTVLAGVDGPLADLPTVRLIANNASTAFVALTTYRLGP